MDACDRLREKGRAKMKDLSALVTELAMSGITKEEICACIEAVFGRHCTVCRIISGRRSVMMKSKISPSGFRILPHLKTSPAPSEMAVFMVWSAPTAPESPPFCVLLPASIVRTAVRFSSMVSRFGDNPEVKRRIAYVPDELYFLGGANLMRMERMYRAIYPDFDPQRFRTLCKRLELPQKKSLGQFSKGMRRQAATILALACRPDYLFFDETFDGLDPVMRNFVKRPDLRRCLRARRICHYHLPFASGTGGYLRPAGAAPQGWACLESDIEDLKTTQFKIQIAFAENYDKSKFCGYRNLPL